MDMSYVTGRIVRLGLPDWCRQSVDLGQAAQDLGMVGAAEAAEVALDEGLAGSIRA
jgi:hypothetical protein